VRRNGTTPLPHEIEALKELQDGKPFTILADFDGESSKKGKNSRVYLRNISSKKIKYLKKSTVWKIPRPEVEKMLSRIIQQHLNPSSLPKFNLLGRNSLLGKSNQANCFDWSQDILRIIRVTFGKPLLKRNLFSAVRLYLSSAKLDKEKKKPPKFYAAKNLL
jgi:hypothetical protein